MVWFVCGLLVLIVGTIVTGLVIRKMNDTYDEQTSYAWMIAPVLIGIALIIPACIYTQDIGEAVVLKNFGGSLAGYTTEAGFHVKAPWQDATSWDIRNRLINFYRDSEYAYDNGSYSGATVTINDSSGTKADCDVQVIYSINPDAVQQLYADYGNQEAYVSSYVSNDVRQTVRDCAGQFSTIQLLTNKEEFANAITEALGNNWADSGVVVESVQVQDIRYADSITEAYANAQSAQVEQQRAQNEQDTARIEAETKAIEAEGIANSNRILAESLTPEVLQQNYYDTLKEIGDKGNVVVVPEGSQPIVQTKN